MSLAVALTKGRLEKSVTAMLEECGYGVERLKDKSYVVPPELYQLFFVLLFVYYYVTSLLANDTITLI